MYFLHTSFSTTNVITKNCISIINYLYLFISFRDAGGHVQQLMCERWGHTRQTTIHTSLELPICLTFNVFLSVGENPHKLEEKKCKFDLEMSQLGLNPAISLLRGEGYNNCANVLAFIHQNISTLTAKVNFNILLNLIIKIYSTLNFSCSTCVPQ